MEMPTTWKTKTGKTKCLMFVCIIQLETKHKTSAAAKTGTAVVENRRCPEAAASIPSNHWRRFGREAGERKSKPTEEGRSRLVCRNEKAEAASRSWRVLGN
jgi:hypothetical protein